MKRVLLSLLLVAGLASCQSVEPGRKGARGRFIEPRTVFVGQPLLVEEVEGKRLWRLMRDVIYETSRKELIVSRAGRVTDYASIPKPFWSIWPPYDPRWGKAAVIHDELYKLKGRYPGRTYTRRESDIVFLEAMNDLGAGYFIRHTMFNCVRVFNREWNLICATYY